MGYTTDDLVTHRHTQHRAARDARPDVMISFLPPANTVTLLGNVLLTKEKNVLRGDRLIVDLTTGVSRVESDSGRVQGVFQTSPGAQPGGGAGGAAAPQGRDGASKKPLKLNGLSGQGRRDG